MQIVLK